MPSARSMRRRRRRRCTWRTVILSSQAPIAPGSPDGADVSERREEGVLGDVLGLGPARQQAQGGDEDGLGKCFRYRASRAHGSPVSRRPTSSSSLVEPTTGTSVRAPTDRLAERGERHAWSGGP
jgi:hypothetical protein